MRIGEFTINIGANEPAHLTTAHPASSYGMPVLVCGDKVYGHADTLPNGHRADIYVFTTAGDCDFSGELINKFCSQIPNEPARPPFCPMCGRPDILGFVCDKCRGANE